jgi:dipeptidyl aminopeptidase/acylaminoacyl peptidase
VKLKHTSGAIALVATLASVTASHAAPPPIEAFGHRPALIDVDINPAGTRLAMIEDDGTAASIAILDLATGKDVRRLNTPKTTRLRGVYWVNDETIIIDERVTYSIDGKERNAREWQRWAAVDASGGTDRFLLMSGDRKWVTGASLVRRQTARPGKVFLSTLDFSAANYRQETGSRLSGRKKDSGWIDNLYEVDVASGEGRVLANGNPFTVSWLTDENADVVLRSDLNSTSDRFEIAIKKGAGWRTLHSTPACGELSFVSLSSDQSAVVLHGSGCGGTLSKLWSLPLDGSPIKPLLEGGTLDIESVIVDPLDERVLGARLGGAEPSTRWMDEAAERRAAGLHRSFADSSITLVGRSADAKRLVVLVEGARKAPVYYLIDYVARKADIINERYPRLNDYELAKVREFPYQARDSYGLLAYLTVPNGAREESLPVVVLPHGGPEARDDPRFDWLAQFLASRGYAVFQPQFRGSSGFGRAHADAGRKQWGLRMQDDVTDGVRALIEARVADPKRICIVGASYGGYAALAGATFTPDLYACAASVNGVSDLPAMIGYAERMSGEESNSLAYWRDHIGSPRDAQVLAKSPARSAGTVRIPILLLHGTDDTIVPIAQSRTMAKALDAYDRKFQLIELPGDDHHLSLSASRVRTLAELERFLAANLAPAAAAPGPAATN